MCQLEQHSCLPCSDTRPQDKVPRPLGAFFFFCFPPQCISPLFLPGTQHTQRRNNPRSIVRLKSHASRVWMSLWPHPSLHRPPLHGGLGETINMSLTWLSYCTPISCSRGGSSLIQSLFSLLGLSTDLSTFFPPKHSAFFAM